jgi:hypothetical protein
MVFGFGFKLGLQKERRFRGSVEALRYYVLNGLLRALYCLLI